MGHHHSHSHLDHADKGEKQLWWAIAANVALTLAQIIGGALSGSLSLIADAIHNLSDAASLVIALIAIRIGKRPPDQNKTFGYKRAETIAALINLTTLVIVGFYLCYEAVTRFIAPVPITGWTVINVAAVALIIDIFTAVLVYSRSKESLNFRAAFLHNLTDALASVGVIISGISILLFDWVWVDALVTLLIAAYILYHGASDLPKTIHILMDGTPTGIDLSQITEKLRAEKGVIDIHHLHVRQISEQSNGLEAHVVHKKDVNVQFLKIRLKKLLNDKFSIDHSTLEFEEEGNCAEKDHCSI